MKSILKSCLLSGVGILIFGMIVELIQYKKLISLSEMGIFYIIYMIFFLQLFFFSFYFMLRWAVLRWRNVFSSNYFLIIFTLCFLCFFVIFVFEYDQINILYALSAAFFALFLTVCSIPIKNELCSDGK